MNAEDLEFAEYTIGKSRTLFHHLSPNRVKWDYMVLLLACVNCFMVPVEVAVEAEFEEAPAYEALNIVVDVIFMMDILVSFNTTYED